MSASKSAVKSPAKKRDAGSSQTNGRVTFADLNTINLDSNPKVVVDVSLDGISDIFYGDRAHWESMPGFIPPEGNLVVWSDRGKAIDDQENEINVPGIKVGDGKAYNLDLPFVGDDIASRIMSLITEHINDEAIHVSQSDRIRWNRKINTSDTVQNETLVLDRN